MNYAQRLEAIRADMKGRGLDLLVALNDGSHYSGSDDPVFAMTGFRSLGEAAIVLGADQGDVLAVTPAWDADRAAERAPQLRIHAGDRLVETLRPVLSSRAAKVGVAGLASLSAASARQVGELLGANPRKSDDVVMAHARAKTDEEIAAAHVATRIAEQGWARMQELARPGVREDELAVELNGYMRELGAQDNFFMLTSGPTNRAVQPCSSRRFEKGDFVLTELSPLVRGQMTQICRTIYLGQPSDDHRYAYALLKRGFEKGLEAAKPGAPMSAVCNAVDAVLEAEGYAEYSSPPWLRLRRRGHGLGLGSTLPGDVAPDNDIVLEPGMFFVLHPNQYLPQTGYLMCGEPVLITPEGGRAISSERAELGALA